MKVLKFALCVCLALSFFPKVAFAADMSADVVVIIDASNSMEGDPLENEKNAAIKFCEQYNGRVAIISCANSASLIQTFTSEKQTLIEAIEGITVNGSTDLEESLSLAQITIDSYANPNVNHIVLVMSDGVASIGEMYNGQDARYKFQSYGIHETLFSSSHEERASAVYNTAKSMTNCEIATMYFLPSDDNNYEGYISLGQDVMRDIATLGNINVPSTDSLASAMISMADTMNDSSDADTIRTAISAISDSAKDASYVFNREYDLPYRLSVINNTPIDSKMHVDWDDDHFIDSSGYNHELAKVCVTLCDNNYGDKDLLWQNLRTLGFDGIEKYNPPGEAGIHTTHFTMAAQQITIGEEEKNFIIVIIDGTEGSAEWQSNFSLVFNDYDADYHGFRLPAIHTMNTIEKYQDEHELSTDPADNIFLLTGHSRGGAVANLLAANMIDRNKAVSKQIFTYTFAAPHTTQNLGAAKFSNVFNIVNSYDPVTKVPPYAWRYGVSLGYGAEHIGHLLDFLRQMQNPLDAVITSLPGIISHTSDVYLTMIDQAKPLTAWVGIGWHFVSIDCPVDVEVTHDGEVVARITDGVVDESVTDPQLVAFTVGYGKRLILPDDQSYTITITATADGTMNYLVDHVDGDSTVSPSNLVSEMDIPLRDGDVFVAEITGEQAETPVLASETAPSIDEIDDTDPVIWVFAVAGGMILGVGIAIGAVSSNIVRSLRNKRRK